MKLFISKFVAPLLTIAILVIILVPLTTPITASAQLSNLLSAPTSYTPLAPLPDVTSPGLSFAKTIDFKSYVTYAFNLLIALGAVAAVFMITWGGFEYMTTDAVNGKKEGLTKIQNAIYGLLLILSSYLILRTIDPRFVNISATLVPPLTVKGGSNLSSWQMEMNAVSAQSQATADSATAANNQAKALVTSLQQQLTAAQAAEDAACDETNPAFISQADCDAKVNNTNSIQDQLDTAEGKATVTAYDQAATGIVNTTTSGGQAVQTYGQNINTYQSNSAETLQQALAANQTLHNKALIAANGDPQAIQTINQMYNASNAEITIQNELLTAENAPSYSRAQAVTQAITLITTAQNIQDQNLKNTSNPDPYYTSTVQSVDKTAASALEELNSMPGNTY